MESTQRFAAFLFYVEDWLSSTAIDLMTAAEERGYLRLLLHAWKAPDCGLPNDERALASLSKLGRAWHTGSGSVVRAEFFERDGRLYNERLLKERENQKAIRSARSDAGRAGAESRWHGKRIAEPMAKPIANAWQAGCQNDASSSSNTNTRTNTSIVLDPEDKFLLLWNAHPRKSDRYLAEQMFAEILMTQPDQWQAIADGHAAYLRSEGATSEGGKFVISLLRFLRDRRWLDDYKTVPDTAEDRITRMIYGEGGDE